MYLPLNHLPAAGTAAAEEAAQVPAPRKRQKGAAGQQAVQLQEPEAVQVLRGHAHCVAAVDWMSDGSLLSCSHDHSVRCQTDRLAAEPRFQNQVKSRERQQRQLHGLLYPLCHLGQLEQAVVTSLTTNCQDGRPRASLIPTLPAPVVHAWAAGQPADAA